MRRKPTNLFSEKYPLLHAGQEQNYLRYDALLDEAKGFLPHGKLYLNSALHDARVTAIDWERHSATIWINDYPTHCFCHALGTHFQEKALNWDTVLPLGIRFHDVSILTVSRISRNDKILPLSKTRHLPSTSEVLEDEARILRADGIELGMLFDAYRRRKTNKGNLLFEVSCRHMEFIELQRERFTYLLGGKYLDHFDAFWEARCTGVRFDFSGSLEFIEQWKPTNA